MTMKKYSKPETNVMEIETQEAPAQLLQHP